MLESEVWKKRAGRDFKGDMRSVSQLLKWKKEGGKVGQKRKREKSGFTGKFGVRASSG